MLRCADVAQGEAAISLFFRHAAREEFDVELLKGERERIVDILPALEMRGFLSSGKGGS